jgi:hypothetical protein
MVNIRMAAKLVSYKEIKMLSGTCSGKTEVLCQQPPPTTRAKHINTKYNDACYKNLLLGEQQS